MVQQLRQLEPERQISQKAERAEPKAAEETRDVLDVTGTKTPCEDQPAEDRTKTPKQPNRRLIKEQLT